MATMDDVEIAVSLKDNISSGMGKIKNTFNGLKSAGGSALNSLANSFSMVDSVAMSALGSATGKTTNEYIMGATKTAEVNKVLIKSMGDTAAQAESMYNTIDKVTNNHLTSMQTLIPAMNAFKAATGASGATMEANADKIASFGDNVLALTGSEERAQTAMMDLSKGIKGAYASLDQYGISEEALMRTGLWSGKEDDVEGYLAAVEEVAGANDDMMNTMQGLEAKIGKAFSRSGKQIGEGMLPGLKEATQGFLALDEATGGWVTKGILIGTEAISIGAQIGGALGQISQGVGAARDAISAAKERWKSFWDGIKEGKEACEDAKEGLDKLRDAVDNSKNSDSKSSSGDLPSGKDTSKAPEVSFESDSDTPKKGKKNKYKNIEDSLDQESKDLDNVKRKSNEVSKKKSDTFKKPKTKDVDAKKLIDGDNSVKNVKSNPNKYKGVEVALENEKKGLKKVNNKVGGVKKEADILSKTTKDADKMSKSGKNLNKMGKAIPAGTGSKMATAGAEAGQTAGGLSAFSSGVMTMLVPLLQIAAVIAIMIPVVAALVAEALLFAKAIGELVKALDFKSMNLDQQIEGIKKIGQAVFELGIVMGAMTFTAVLTHMYNWVTGFGLMGDPLKKAVTEVKRIAPLLAQLGSMPISPAASTKLNMLKNSLKSLNTAFAAMGTVVGGVILGNIMTLNGLLGSFTSNLKKAKDELINAAKIIKEIENTPDIPKEATDKLKRTSESLKAVAEAMSALSDVNWDINMGNIVNMGGFFGTITSHLRDAKEEIMKAAPILNSFSGMQTIDKSVGENLKNVSEALKSAASAIKDLSSINDAMGGDGVVGKMIKLNSLVLALKTAKKALKSASTELSSLAGLPTIPDDVKIKVSKVGSTAKLVIDCLKPLTTLSNNDNLNAATITGKIQQARYAISNSATHLASLSGIANIGDDLKTKVSKVGTTAKIVIDTLKPLNEIVGQEIKSSMITSRIAQARYAISNSATHLASLNGIATVGQGLGEKLNSVGTAAKKVSTISTTLAGIPQVGEGASVKVHNSVAAIKKMITELRGLSGGGVGNVSNVLSSVRRAMKQVSVIVRSSAGSARSSGASVGRGIKNGIRSGMNGLSGAITPLVRSAMNHVKQTAQSGAKTAGTQATNAFKSSFKIANIAKQEMNYAVQAVNNGSGALAEACRRAAQNAVDAAKEGADSHSPGAIARMWGKEIGVYSVQKVNSGAANLIRTVRNISQSVVRAFGNPELMMNMGLNSNINPNNLSAYKNVAMQKASSGNNSGIQYVVFNFEEGCMQLDARNLTTKESKQILINALEGLDPIKNINIKGM